MTTSDTHEGYDQAGALTSHRGLLEDCYAPECQDRVIALLEDAENEQAAAEAAAACPATFREDPMPDTVYCAEKGPHSRHTAWQGSNYYVWMDGDEGCGWDAL
jgi:hypothetical protein